MRGNVLFVYIQMESYGLPIKELGEGGYGKVTHYRKEGKDYAIKTERVFEGIPSASFFQENTLRSLDHPNVIKVIDSGIDEASGNSWIIYPMAVGDLESHVEKNPEYLRSLFFQLVNGVAYLTSRGIIHVDIKPANILIFPNNILQIADFGLAKNIYCGASFPNAVGTLWYSSPETLLSRLAAPSNDVWGVACIIYEKWTGRVAFEGEDVEDQMTSIVSELGLEIAQWPEVVNYKEWTSAYQRVGKRILLNRITNPLLKDLLSRMFVLNPKQRYNIYQVMQHPFFANAITPVTLPPITIPSCVQLLSYRELPKAREYGINNVILFSWLTETAIDRRVNINTLTLALVLCNYFLDTNSPPPGDMQGYAIVALMMATIYKEDTPISFYSAERVTNNMYPETRLETFFNNMAKFYNYNLYYSTPQDYLIQELKVTESGERINRNTNINSIVSLFLSINKSYSCSDNIKITRSIVNVLKGNSKQLITEDIRKVMGVIVNNAKHYGPHLNKEFASFLDSLRPYI